MTLASHVGAVAAAIEARQRPALYVRRLSWLAPMLGPMMGELVIETRGSWVLQRHLLTCVLKNDVKGDGPMTLRASTAVIRWLWSRPSPCEVAFGLSTLLSVPYLRIPAGHGWPTPSGSSRSGS